jgi:hypothetical protein
LSQNPYAHNSFSFVIPAQEVVAKGVRSLFFSFPLWGKVGIGADGLSIGRSGDLVALLAPIPAIPQRGKGQKRFSTTSQAGIQGRYLKRRRLHQRPWMAAAALMVHHPAGRCLI